MDCSPPGSSIHGIFQERILEWVATSFSRGSSQPRDQTHVSSVYCIGRWVLYPWAAWEVLSLLWSVLNRCMNTERALGTQRGKQLALAGEVGEGFTREDLIFKVGLEECAWGVKSSEMGAGHRKEGITGRGKKSCENAFWARLMVPETEARWVEGRILGVLEEGKWRNDAGHLVRVRWRNTRTHRKVTWPVLISIQKAVGLSLNSFQILNY